MYEASYFDRINMTENGLEYDQKIFTPTNVNAVFNVYSPRNFLVTLHFSAI